jgi:hypothetical protein
MTSVGEVALDQAEDGLAGVYMAEGLTRLREVDERWQAASHQSVRGYRRCTGAAAWAEGRAIAVEQPI